MDNKLKLYIVRHGQTEWNVLEKFQGQLNSPLTPKGIKKIEKTASELKNIKFEAVYTSELGRTISTAKLILQNLCKGELFPLNKASIISLLTLKLSL